MTDRHLGPGWDAQAINIIAEEHYGGLKELFEAHGWPERGSSMMPIQQRRVAEVYGSVANFVRDHEFAALMDPFEAIERDPPNVWLTSAYVLFLGNWGFTEKRMRASFIRKNKPGVLVVIYGASRSAPQHRGKIIGLQQQSHTIGHAREFMSETAWNEKKSNPRNRDRWNYTVKTCRAWMFPPESTISLQDFAPITYTPNRSQAIGAWGMKLRASEARRILHLDLVEEQVFGGPTIEFSTPAAARDVLTPSRPGPVSQSPYVVQQAEGPKHLYILKLNGDEDAFLGRSVSGRWIIKVGFYRSPATRCEDHNRALPIGAFKWTVYKSTFEDGRGAYPTSGNAKAGEQTMKDTLAKTGKTLGGEFFLAGRAEIESAWQRAVEDAEKWDGP